MKKMFYIPTILLLAPFFNSCSPTEYNISIVKIKNEEHEDANFTYTTSTPKPKRGTDFYVYFKPIKFFDITNDNIEVIVNNEPFLELDKFWKYDHDSHTLKIWGEIVTGNIKINVMPDLGQYEYKVYVNNWTTTPAAEKDPVTQEMRIYKGINRDVSLSYGNIVVNDADFDGSYINAPSWLEYNYVPATRTIEIPNSQFYRDITITLNAK